MRIQNILTAWIIGASACAMARGASPEPSDAAGAKNMTIPVYIGTGAGKQAKGIYFTRLNLKTGELAEPTLSAESPRPTFLALHPSQKYLYAVAELQDTGGKKGGAVRAFAADATEGKLTLLNEQPSGGPGPCYVSVDVDGKNLLVANYTGGSLAVLPIDSDGKLKPISAFDQHAGRSVDPQRQTGPFAHCFDLDPTHKYVLGCDLGLDKVFVYKFDPSHGAITPNDPPTASVSAGAGPRHLAFHPSGRFVYVINEMGSSVTAFSYDDGAGALKELQTISTLPPDFKGNNNTCAEIAVHPSGQFVYGSNRGHDSIAMFSADPQTGKLTATGHQSVGGRVPRHLAIAPGGEFLVAANQDSGNLSVFRIDPSSGQLTPAGAGVKVPSPMCVLFVPPTK